MKAVRAPSVSSRHSMAVLVNDTGAWMDGAPGLSCVYHSS